MAEVERACHPSLSAALALGELGAVSLLILKKMDSFRSVITVDAAVTFFERAQGVSALLDGQLRSSNLSVRFRTILIDLLNFISCKSTFKRVRSSQNEMGRVG
jgi:hypothetical protein